MKSKKLNFVFGVSLLILLLGALWIYLSSLNPLAGTLDQEWLDQRYTGQTEGGDSDWQLLPFGYTFGPWPAEFKNEPIVTKLTYEKGPPSLFLQSMTQLWQSIEIELTLLGPHTLSPNMNQSDWKSCFQSHFLCNSKRWLIMKYIAHKKTDGKLAQVTWFDQQDPNAPRGVHLLWDHPQYQIHDFVVITEKGIAQGFELKTVKTDIGDQAVKTLYQILGSMKVDENLKNSRSFIQDKIKPVELAKIQNIADEKSRLKKLIEVQGWLFSLLSVDPSQVTPFFHLAGVTHLFALDLLKAKTHYFENQESWILYARPNLNALQKYAADFDHGTGPESMPKQIEALIQDVLLVEDQNSSKH